MRKIKVKYVSTYKDGGTVQYADEAGTRYFVDNRIGSTTKGKVYTKYPTHVGATRINVQLIIQK